MEKALITRVTGKAAGHLAALADSDLVAWVRSRFAVKTIVAALLVVSFGEAHAARAASPILAPDHWAVEAVDRLEGVGLLDGWMPAQKGAPVLAVVAAIDRALASAESERPDLVPVITAWRARLGAEFGGAGDHSMVLGGHVGAGYSAARLDELEARVAPDALHAAPEDISGFVSAGAAVLLQRHFAASATARLSDSGAELRDGEIIAALGSWSLSVGRARSGFGFSRVGGVMLSGEAAMDRVELMTTDPVHLPWFLRRSGSWTFDAFVARLRGPMQPDRPLFWGTSLRWRLNPRLTLGIQRAIIFGGQPWEGFPTWHRALVIVGLDNYRENNMLSASARWRLPTETLLPLTATLDWGTDDDPLAAGKIPGLVAGVSAPMLGSLPAEVGIEYAFFGRLCCRAERRTFPWYYHRQYRGGWTTGELPLGDPIGGNGRALRVHGSIEPWNGLVRVASAAWVQDRFSTNLYSPQLGGRSVGARAAVEVRWSRGTLELRGAHERGQSGWQVDEGGLEARLFF